MLERLVATGNGAARRLAHARILLLADSSPGQSRHDEDIRAALGTSLRTIERVRPNSPHKPTPDHSSLTRIRQRLPLRCHEQVFVFVLKLAEDNGLLPGKTIGVDSTFLDANASLKTIVRRDSGRDWKE